MKIHNRRFFTIFLIAITVIFSSCRINLGGELKNEAVSLDYIFSTNSVGITTITMRRSEWNKMLTYYDYFYKSENNVDVISYQYEKDGKTWTVKDAGLRLRGNTSRFRPQGVDSATDQTGHYKDNAGWSDFYSNEGLKNIYRQSHFKVDFEDNKMADCMKGVALKRCDSYFSKEIFCYYLFHQYGIWTAPRASQTKVYIDLIEDVQDDGSTKSDISGCSKTTVDFGVYEMFEEVNSQSVKARSTQNYNNTVKNAWKSSDGDLWKCSGGNLTASSNTASNFGCENIKILDTTLPRDQWGSTNWTWERYNYDLKTNKEDVAAATAKFQGFISELNALSDINQFSAAGIKARKAFYEKWFDVDFFIKTYAVDILCGMDDDYWGNANNYYLYFDNGTGGTGKCYLLPFDYDNTLGSSINRDKVYVNPLQWGYNEDSVTHVVTKADRPLLDRLLEVPEYVEKMKKTLLEVASQDGSSPWNKYRCISVWYNWIAQTSPYVYSADVAESGISPTSFYDYGGWKSTKHYLTQLEDNIYEQTTENFKYWLSTDRSISFDLNGGSINGQTGIVSVEYNGVSQDYENIIDTPVRDGYEFTGWTSTKNGTDYTTKYNDEENLTVYAKWQDVSGFSGLTIYQIEDSTYDGIKIGIYNPPENNYRRTFSIREINESSYREIGSDAKDGSKYKKIWAYPFVEPGKTYKIKVVYLDKDYGGLTGGESNHLQFTATSGLGEFKVTNTPAYKIENNTLKWTTPPQIQIGDGVSPASGSNWSEYYLLELMSNNPWSYLTWNYLGASCDADFDFKNNLESNGKTAALNGSVKDLYFTLRYIYTRSEYGDYYLYIINNNGSTFNLN